MALLDDVKVALRVSSDSMDVEVQALIDAAQRDMLRVGVPEDMVYGTTTTTTEYTSTGAKSTVEVTTYDPLCKMAVVLYAKAHFGYDNDEAARFLSAYKQTLIDMRNSYSLYGGSE